MATTEARFRISWRSFSLVALESNAWTDNAGRYPSIVGLLSPNISDAGGDGMSVKVSGLVDPRPKRFDIVYHL